MESTTAKVSTEDQDLITDITLIEQDKSTVKILQEDDLQNLKEAVEKIKSFKRKYSLKKLQVTDIESKDQKEKLRLAIADVRTTKTSLEKDKKEKTLPYRNTVAYINNNYDKVIDAAESILNPLKDHKKEVDEKVEAKEKEEELALQQRVNERVSKIIAAGLSFDGQYYSIGSEEFNVAPISLGIVDIQTMTDGIFENILQQAIDKAAVIAAETEKANAEKKRLEDERIAKELEDKRLFDLQQAQLKKEQDELAAELAEFKKQKEELRLAQEKLEQDKLKEEQRLLKIEQDKKDAVIKDAAEKKAAEDKIILDKAIADKALADKKAQDELDENNRLEALNKQGDQAVWSDFISRLKAITYPEMKSQDFKNKVGSVRDFISNLK